MKAQFKGLTKAQRRMPIMQEEILTEAAAGAMLEKARVEARQRAEATLKLLQGREADHGSVQRNKGPLAT